MRLPVFLGALLAVAVGALTTVVLVSLLAARAPLVPPVPTPTVVPGQFGLYTPPPTASPSVPPTPSPSPVVVGETAVPIGTQIGQRAPALRLPGLIGGEVDTSSTGGRPSWVYFMATWCPDCRDELPMMQRYLIELDDQLDAIVVDVEEDPDDVLSFMLSLEVDLLVALDEDGAAMREWNVTALPMHFFIDGDGIVQDIIFGGAPREVFVGAIQEVVPDADLEP